MIGTLHRSFACSQRQRRILGSIVEPLVGDPNLSIIMCVAAALCFFNRRRISNRLAALGTAAVLNNLVQDIAILVDGPRKPMFLICDTDDDFSQMPDIVRA